MRYFLELSYNGKNYAGWQRQNNAVSVQEVLEDNLSKILNNKIEIVGCGRTDAGVHAKQYFAHVDIEKALPENFLYRINNMLPEDIAIQKIFNVKPDFHARFDAINRTYNYFIHFEKNPLKIFKCQSNNYVDFDSFYNELEKRGYDFGGGMALCKC